MRPPTTPMYRASRHASASPEPQGSPPPSAAGARVADTLNKLGQSRGPRTPSRGGATRSSLSVAPAAAASPSGSVSSSAVPQPADENPLTSGSGLHLVERTFGAVQLSSHGKGRVIVTGVHPAGYVPPRRQAYLEWIARQQQQQQPPEGVDVRPILSAADYTLQRGVSDGSEGSTAAAATDIDSRVQALRSPSARVASALGSVKRSASASPSPGSPSLSASRATGLILGASITSIPAAASSEAPPFNSAVYSAFAESKIPGAHLHGSASLPFLGGPRAHLPGTAPTASAGRYPKVLYSGYRISNIPHESGSDFAYYSTAAARKRVQVRGCCRAFSARAETTLLLSLQNFTFTVSPSTVCEPIGRQRGAPRRHVPAGSRCAAPVWRRTTACGVFFAG